MLKDKPYHYNFYAIRVIKRNKVKLNHLLKANSNPIFRD
jgi:hypothetical protein